MQIRSKSDRGFLGRNENLPLLISLKWTRIELLVVYERRGYFKRAEIEIRFLIFTAKQVKSIVMAIYLEFLGSIIHNPDLASK